MKYMCNTTCWVAWKKAMFNVGDIVDFAEGEVVPSHFTSMEPPKEVKVEDEEKHDPIVAPSHTDHTHTMAPTMEFKSETPDLVETDKPKKRHIITKE